MYKSFFPSGGGEKFCEHMFRGFDSDRSGIIDFKKFLIAINITRNGSPEDKLHWAFRMYDIDGSGTIEEKEMMKIIEVLNIFHKIPFIYCKDSYILFSCTNFRVLL